MTTLPPRNPNDQNEDKSWGMADMLFATPRSKNVPMSFRFQMVGFFLAFAIGVVIIYRAYESDRQAVLNDFNKKAQESRKELDDLTRKAISDLNR
ncbi:MAG: hypothetical protein ACO3GX_14680 [Gemmataceae bacterium]